MAFDYATPMYRSLGYSFRIVERLEKQERKAERLAIMEDIQNGKPVLAISLRVAPEWGVITGYTDNGNQFLCRTYFDREIFEALEQDDDQSRDDRRMVYEDNEGYLFSDFWPFIIIHFGEKRDVPSPLDILKTSLTTMINSFHAEECRGYHQGKEAYKAWIGGLATESDFQLETDRESVLRRLDVNDNMLLNLIDARRSAASWLHENISLIPVSGRQYLERIAENCQSISDTAAAFQQLVNHLPTCEIAYNTTKTFGVSTPELRKEQIHLLENALILEEENCRLAELILAIPEMRV